MTDGATESRAPQATRWTLSLSPVSPAAAETLFCVLNTLGVVPRPVKRSWSSVTWGAHWLRGSPGRAECVFSPDS